MPAIILTLLLCCICLPAMAEERNMPPLPQKKSEVVGSFDQRIEDSKKKSSTLKQEADKIESDLGTLQKKLVKIASSMRKNEGELNELDKEISSLEAEQDELRDGLKKDRGEMADLLLALQRIRRMPPEAMIAKPDSPLKTAQSAMLLENTLPVLFEKAEKLKVDLKRNDELAQELKTKRKKVRLAANSLQKEHKELLSLAQKRKSLYRKTQSDIAEQEKATKRIAADAKNLKDLVENLEEQRQRKIAQKNTHRAVLSKPKTALPNAGSGRLPISGVIKTRYNQPDHFGAPSKGIDIEGRGGALVVAPMGGVVRYAGTFKNYGRMVIIEHKGSYHSLIGGLNKIDAIVGQSVTAGEPVGFLHYADNPTEKPVLYYELRYNGKAVNPAKKISGLS